MLGVLDVVAIADKEGDVGFVFQGGELWNFWNANVVVATRVNASVGEVVCRHGADAVCRGGSDAGPF